MDKKAQFQIQKVYLKDLSFSIPNYEKIWKTSWNPELSTDLKVKSSKLPEEDTYESVIFLKVTVKNSGILAFEIDLKQAGIFSVSNMEEDQIMHARQSFCPNIIYHYAREAVSDLVISGGFPQLCLSAVNFDEMHDNSANDSKSENKH